MIKKIADYILVIAAYMLLFFILDLVPFTVSFNAAVFISCACMAATFIFLSVKYNSFADSAYYLFHTFFLVFVCFFSIVFGTLLVNTDPVFIGEWYYIVIGLNISVIFMTVLLFVFSILKKNWTNLLYAIIHSVMLGAYLYLLG